MYADITNQLLIQRMMSVEERLALAQQQEDSYEWSSDEEHHGFISRKEERGAPSRDMDARSRDQGEEAKLSEDDQVIRSSQIAFISLGVTLTAEPRSSFVLLLNQHLCRHVYHMCRLVYFPRL